MKKLFALRGATQCQNIEADICLRIGTMYDELLISNKLDINDIVSVMFSVTSDLDALNPSTALRRHLSYDPVYALFSAQEPKCKNSLERTIRVIIHCYLDEDSKIRHVYLNGTENLRK